MANAAGCYGFRVDGVADARHLLVETPPDWPRLELRLVRPTTGAAPESDVVGPETAALPLHRGGWTTIERQGRRVTFHLAADTEHQELVHPYLAPAAAVLARWAGRESFHAGAVVGDGGAWAVLGDRESGKSSTLGWLALNGHRVLVDDLLVLDGEAAFAGPRCVDLRPDAAARLGAGEPLGVVGSRERWRLPLDAVPARVPLRGWIVLSWGEATALEPLRGPERLLALMPHRSVRLEPPAPGALVRLASLPVLVLRRPRRWDSLPDAAARLVAAIGG
jgi:hypothetical protein